MIVTCDSIHIDPFGTSYSFVGERCDEAYIPSYIQSFQVVMPPGPCDTFQRGARYGVHLVPFDLPRFVAEPAQVTDAAQIVPCGDDDCSVCGPADAQEPIDVGGPIDAHEPILPSVSPIKAAWEKVGLVLSLASSLYVLVETMQSKHGAGEPTAG